MRIEVISVPDCPHTVAAVARVREALAIAGRSDAVVTERTVEDASAAGPAGMLGSPTILVDGRDPFATGGPEASLSCRLYPSADGFEGAPSLAALIEVLL